jgi:hypothetical protein
MLSTYIALPQFDKVGFAGRLGLASSFADLIRVALDADHASILACPVRHETRELGQPRAEVENPLATPKAEFGERSIIQDIVQPGESLLLFGEGAVDIF